MRTYILFSYPKSVHLGIIEFKVPHEATSTTVRDAFTNTSEPKHITYSSPIQSDTPIIKKKTNQLKPKPLLKSIKPLQDHLKTATFQDTEMQKITPL